MCTLHHACACQGDAAHVLHLVCYLFTFPSTTLANTNAQFPLDRHHTVNGLVDMRLAADVLGSCCLCARGHGMSVYANIIMPWTTSTVYTVQNGCCDYVTKFAPRSCFSSHSSSSMHSAAKQRSCGSESSLSQQKGAKKNPLESISEGSPMTRTLCPSAVLLRQYNSAL